MRVTRALAPVLALMIGGCASLGPLGPEATGDVPPEAHVAGVPLFVQTVDHCGPAALAMVLGASGVEVWPADLARLAWTPGRRGSLQADLISATRRHGRVAYEIAGAEGALLREIAAGNPVLVLQNLGLGWLPRWHYSVVVGYDLAQGLVALHAGTERARVIGLSTFRRTWARAGHWGLLVLAPETLPASLDEASVVDAIAALERAGGALPAETAYGTGTRRWPDSLGAWMGLGNTRYARGDLPGAERAFLTATERHPDSAAALNNLAHVLAERGQREAALRTIDRAIALGGPDTPTWRRTRREITGEEDVVDEPSVSSPPRPD